jgi:dTMP kinase
MFIVLEGIDGSGKSTQAKLLFEYIKSKDKKVILTVEPTNDTPIGKLIRSILQHEWKTNLTALELLFCADRADHVEKINAWQKEGNIVISDRYFFSTISYVEGVKNKELSDYFELINKVFPTPDLSIFVDLSPDEAIKRISASGKKFELFEKKDSLTKIRNSYLRLSKLYPNVHVIDGNGTQEEVFERIKKVLNI